MSNNTIHARIVSMHDVEERWNQAVTFIPRAGEIIVYDVDTKHLYPRFKIGDGITSVVDLPFSIDLAIETFFGESNGVIRLNGGNIKDYA